jgi:hypothetical protein
MPYDPNGVLRSEEEELQLTEEGQKQAEALQRAAELEDAQAAEQVAGQPSAAAPTGETESTPTPAASTEAEEEFDPTKDFSYYEARGMSRKEWNKRRLGGLNVGSDVEGFATDPRYAWELAMSVPTGGLDFAVDMINIIPGVNLPKLTKFENESAQAIRQVSSVVLPTMTGTGVLRAGGLAAQSRVGWSLGNTPFMKFLGNRGVEALAGLGVGAVSSEYEGENLLGMAKAALPSQFDFIPDDLATLGTAEEPDAKRKKNIYEDLLTGLVLELAVGTVRLSKAFLETSGILRKTNRMVAQSEASQQWLKANEPPAPTTVEESVTLGMLRQEDALDEVGYYGMSQSMDLDKPIRGVHDLFEYGELGVRTVDDFGVVGASIDQARIARNLGTVEGRLGNIISEPALQYGLRGEGNVDEIVLGLADQLRQADRIGMESDAGWKVTFDDQIDATMDLTHDLFDPRMSRADIMQIIQPYLRVNDAGVQVMDEAGFGMISKALRNFGEQVSAMDVSRAQSLLAGSLSGRVSDLSEGVRLMEGTSAVKPGQEKIIDLMQYLVQLQGSASYYKHRKVGLLKQIQNGFTNITGYNAATISEADEVAKAIFQKSEQFGTTLRAIAEVNPNLMKQFLMGYEMTGGRISSISQLNDYISAMTTNLGKAIIDPNPEVQNKLLAGMWSNIYASYLSAFKTPIEALFGNVGGLISKPTSHFIGAVMHGDFNAIRRGYIAYGAMNESLRRSLPYMGEIFAKASKNPDSVSAITRRDLLLQQEQELELLREVADSQAAEGSWGMQYIVQQIETMNALAKDPRIRFGPNGLIATDGFTGAMIAHSESYTRAVNELMESGLPLTKENLAPIAQKEYNKMFGPDGLIKDEAVRWSTNELALNLDSPLVNGSNALSQHMAFMKPFLMFPTTGANRISMFGKYAPWAPFQKDVNELAFTPLKQLLGNEQYVNDLLSSRGYDVSSMTTLAKVNKITDLKYETLGRKAIGTSAVMGVVSLFGDDRITGDGHYDPQIQRARIQQGWKPRSVKGLDGRYYSYKGLGVLADWIASTVNTIDNFDSIGAQGIETILPKFAFVISAATTDNTGLSSIRPLLQIVSGDTSAATRWAAGFLNGLGPLASQRGEWSRIFADGLRIVDEDVYSYGKNLNRFAAEIDPKTADPFIYSPVSGKKVNSYGFLQRVWNAYMPFPIHDTPSEEEQFLQKIEYPTATLFKTKDGVKIPKQMRSELLRIMGEDGIFRTGIQEVMRSNTQWRSMESFEQLRRQGKAPELATWHSIHERLRAAQRFAENQAYARLDPGLQQKFAQLQVEEQLKQAASRQGVVLDSTLSIRK